MQSRRTTGGNWIVRYCRRVWSYVRSSFIRVFRQCRCLSHIAKWVSEWVAWEPRVYREGETCARAAVRRRKSEHEFLGNAYLVCRNRFANWRALEKNGRRPRLCEASGDWNGKEKKKSDNILFYPPRSRRSHLFFHAFYICKPNTLFRFAESCATRVVLSLVKLLRLARARELLRVLRVKRRKRDVAVLRLKLAR